MNHSFSNATREHGSSLTELETRCVSAALAIGRQLVSEAKWYGDRCYWMTAIGSGGGSDAASLQMMGPGLYNGTAGVGIFLAELFAATGDEEYRDCSRAALRHSLHQLDRIPYESHSSFFAGHTGIAYALHRFAAVDAHEEFDAVAVSLLLGLAINPDRHAGDVISGAAGCIPGLISLFPGERYGFTESLAVQLGELIITKARHHPFGRCSWGPPTGLFSRDLCGYAHGASGFAAALMELWALTNEDVYRHVALKAIAYENAQFSEENQTWPDLRALSFQELLKSEGWQNLKYRIERGEQVQTDTPTFTDVWCHGAPGIGLSRIRGYQLWGLPDLLQDAQVALNATIRVLSGRLGNYSLCHGIFGLLETLVLGSHVRGAPGERVLVDSFITRALENYETAASQWPCGTPGWRNDPSLMLGISGIGHFLLRIANPQLKSLLAPHRDLDRPLATGISSSGSVEQHERDTLLFWFGRSQRVADQIGISTAASGEWSPMNRTDLATAFAASLHEQMEHSEQIDLLLYDASAPELARWQRSRALRCRSTILVERWADGSFDSIDLSHASWRICQRRAELVCTKLNWEALLARECTFDVEALREEWEAGASSVGYVVYETFDGVDLRVLAPFSRRVLEVLSAYSHVGVKLTELVSAVEESVITVERASNLELHIVDQLKAFHSAGIVEALRAS